MRKSLYKSVVPKGLSVAILSVSLLSSSILPVYANEQADESVNFRELTELYSENNSEVVETPESIEDQSTDDTTTDESFEEELTDEISLESESVNESDLSETDNTKEVVSPEVNELSLKNRAINSVQYENTVSIIDSVTNEVLLSFSTTDDNIESVANERLASLNALHSVNYVINSVKLMSSIENSSSFNGNTMTKYTNVYSVTATNTSENKIDETKNPLYPSDTLYDDSNAQRALRSVRVLDSNGVELYNKETISTETVDQTIKNALDMLNSTYPDMYYYRYVEVEIGRTFIMGGPLGYYNGTSYEINITVKKYPVTKIISESLNEAIPFTTEYRESEQLLKGEEKIIQEGVNGTSTSIYDVTYVDDVEESREFVSRSTTLEPITQIIEQGVKEVKREDVQTIIDYNIQKVENDSLLLGEEKVSQAGVAGELTTTYEVTYIRGVETARKSLSEKLTKEAVSQIIQVGTKEIKTETKLEEVPFETEFIQNDALLVGDSKTITAGVVGEQNVTYEVTFVKGKEVSRKSLSNEVLKAPVKQVIEVGSKEVKMERVTEDIPFEVEYVESSELLAGQENVKQVGQVGALETEFEVTYINGQEVKRKELLSTVVTKPVKQIVEKGIREVRSEISVEVIPFETKYENNPELLVGETLVSQAGVVGEMTITENVYFVNGEEVNRQLDSEEVTLSPVDEMIQVGVKEIKIEAVTETIEYDKTYIENPEWLSNVEEIITPGANGEVIVTYEITYVEGIEVSRTELSREVLVAPTTEVIEKGTKEPVKPVEKEISTVNTNTAQQTLPDTGEEKQYAIFSVAVLGIFAGIGLIVPRRKED